MTSIILCNAYTQLLLDARLILVLAFIPPLLIFGLCLLLLRKVVRKQSQRILKISSLSAGLFVCVMLSFATLIITFFLAEFTLEGFGDPIASDYFSVNAAIKNTCYLDPLKRNCPHTLAEIIHIEPEHFSKLLQNKTVYYSFDNLTQKYSLYIQHDINRGVLFDPRLTQQDGYYADFVDTYRCSGAPITPYTGDGNHNGVVKTYIDSIWPSLSGQR